VNATEVHRPDACALCEKAFPSHAPERGYTQYP
jgi:hypothetical protein